jgi:hypothetical protein
LIEVKAAIKLLKASLMSVVAIVALGPKFKIISMALSLLQNYDSAKPNYLVCGCNNGFQIGFQGDRHFRASPNLKSASEFPKLWRKNLQKKFIKLDT